MSKGADMSKPIPEPIDPEKLTELALAVVRADRFPQLATIDGDQPRLRPVSPVKTDGFTVYVANLRRYGKTAEIAANPKVELCYVNAGHDQVRITGVAAVVSDRAVLQEIWDGNPLLRQYLGSLDNPELVVYRVKPTRIRYMKEWSLEYSTVPLPDNDVAPHSDSGVRNRQSPKKPRDLAPGRAVLVEVHQSHGLFPVPSYFPSFSSLMLISRN